MGKWRLFSGMAWGPGLRNSLGGAPIGFSGFWFRVYGWGLHVSTKKREEALFSERYGYRKALYVFGVRIEILSRTA